MNTGSSVDKKNPTHGINQPIKLAPEMKTSFAKLRFIYTGSHLSIDAGGTYLWAASAVRHPSFMKSMVQKQKSD